MTPADLIAFEDEIADEFARGNIKSPVHLSGGNEKQLIKIFKDIKPWDWVFSGWRSHYHCLLKGVPPTGLKTAILAGKSVHLSFPAQKVFCSGICGGIAPIAVGVAWSLHQRNINNHMGHEERCHVFLGDMSAEMGIVDEAARYAANHGLPINWYVEDNGKSVATDTQRAWGGWCSGALPFGHRYEYELARPHCGIGKWVKMDTAA